MKKMNELTVQIENKPGTLASLGEALGKANVNILALMADEAGGLSKVHFVTDKPSKAKKIVANLNLQVAEEEVIGVAIKNKPGTLGDVADKLGKAGVNINHSYCGTAEGSKKPLVIFAVSDLEQAMEALK
jgi:hypothetical protein